MSSRIQRKFTYLRDRTVNAYWMIRQGRFRQVVDSLLLELQTRKEQASTALSPPETPVQQSGGRNPCKPATPSARPAISVESPVIAAQEVTLDQVEKTLRDLLAGRVHAPPVHGSTKP